ESSPNDVERNGGEEGASGVETTQISFIHWRGEDQAVFEEIIAQFEEENANIKVEMNVYPSDQYQSTAQTLIRDGSTGDVFASQPGTQFEAIKNAGLFEDLSNEGFVSNFDENAIEVGQ